MILTMPPVAAYVQDAARYFASYIYAQQLPFLLSQQDYSILHVHMHAQIIFRRSSQVFYTFLFLNNYPCSRACTCSLSHCLLLDSSSPVLKHLTILCACKEDSIGLLDDTLGASKFLCP